MRSKHKFEQIKRRHRNIFPSPKNTRFHPPLHEGRFYRTSRRTCSQAHSVDEATNGIVVLWSALAGLPLLVKGFNINFCTVTNQILFYQNRIRTNHLIIETDRSCRLVRGYDRLGYPRTFACQLQQTSRKRTSTSFELPISFLTSASITKTPKPLSSDLFDQNSARRRESGCPRYASTFAQLARKKQQKIASFRRYLWGKRR